MPTGKKQGILEWLESEKASFPQGEYSFWSGTLAFADTQNGTPLMPRKQKENSVSEQWFLPSELHSMRPTRGTEIAAKKILSDESVESTPVLPTISSTTPKNMMSEDIMKVLQGSAHKHVIGGLKWLDTAIGFLSGTILFGAIQNLGEWLRDGTRENYSTTAYLQAGLGIMLGAIGRVGVFFTQVIAALIRFPLAIISGFMGAITEGLYRITWDYNAENRIPRSTLMLASIGDFVWPFAPKTGIMIAHYPTTTRPDAKSNYRQAFGIGLFSFTAGATVSVFVSLAIATAFSGLILGSTFGIGAPLLVLVPALTGAFTTLFSNVINTVKDNIVFPALEKKRKLDKYIPDEKRSNEDEASFIHQEYKQSAEKSTQSNSSAVSAVYGFSSKSSDDNSRKSSASVKINSNI